MLIGAVFGQNIVLFCMYRNAMNHDIERLISTRGDPVDLPCSSGGLKSTTAMSCPIRHMMPAMMHMGEEVLY